MYVHVNDPDVKLFDVVSDNVLAKDILRVVVGDTVSVSNSRWTKDADGEIKEHGKSITIVMSRNELVGLAHDIVSAAARGDI